MLSPYEIESIQNAKAYFIDNEGFKLFKVGKDKDLVGSGYEMPLVFRSLILKFVDLKEEVIESLYSEDKDKVVFILKYSNNEKYFLEFQVDEDNHDQLNETLNQLKADKDSIINWFRGKLNLKTEEVSTPKELEIFPSYNIPKMPAVANLKEDFEYIKITSIGFNKIKVQSENKDLIPKDVRFKIGTREYTVLVEDFSKKTLEDDVYEFEIKVKFENILSLRDWKNFIIALHRKRRQS